MLTKFPNPQWFSVSQQSPLLVAGGRGSTSENCGNAYSHMRSSRYPLMERFEVRSGDQSPLDASSGSTVERAEQSVDISYQTFSFQKDIWVAYDLMILDGAPLTPFFLLLGQFHHNPDPGDLNASPPWCVEWYNGNLSLTTRTSPLAATPANTPTTRRVLVSNPKRNEWMRFVFKVNFDWQDGGTGGVKAWVNGNLVIDDQTPVGFNDQAGPYAKFGIYRGAALETMAVIYHNVLFGYQDLSYRITTATKLPTASILTS